MRVQRSVKWFLLLLTQGLLVLPVSAGGIPPRPPVPPTSALGKIRDLAATVRVRRLVQQDPMLAKLNLGVEVENGVLVVWGPVPSEEVGKHAVNLLQSVHGIVRVKSDFYLDRSREQLLVDLTRPVDAPERFEVAKPEIETGKLTPKTREPALPVVRTEEQGQEGLTLYAPRKVLSAKMEANGPSENMASKAGTLAEEVQRIRQAEVRFRGIVVQIRDRTIVVRRGEASGRDLMDLMQQLRRIPGIEAVLLAED